MKRRNRLLEDLIGDAYEGYEPKKSDLALSRAIFDGVREQLKFYGRQLLSDGWKFFGAEQKRGWCHYASKTIVIPAWVIRRQRIDYKEWYVAHEMAHAYNFLNGTQDAHGPNFMYFLQVICPEDCVHHELGYKPRNARDAGITKPDAISSHKKQITLDDIF